MSGSASGEEAGWRHEASWCPRLWMNRLRCSCRFIALSTDPAPCSPCYCTPTGQSWEDAMRRRNLIKLIAGMAAAWPVAAHAQTYPSRPITIVVPFAAGGSFDVPGRLLAGRMSEILRPQVIVQDAARAARLLRADPGGHCAPAP